jgi:hypothetical protein
MKNAMDQNKLNNVLVREAARGNTETVKMLLDSGADVHVGDDLARRLASWGGHIETVKVIEAFAAKSPARPAATAKPQKKRFWPQHCHPFT